MTALSRRGIIWPYFYQTVFIIRKQGAYRQYFVIMRKRHKKKQKTKMGDKRQLLGHVKLLQLLRWFNCVRKRSTLL